MDANQDADLRNQVKLTNVEGLYQIKDEYGRTINFEDARGRELFNHYRHNMTNYDNVLDDLREKQGWVSGWQQKQASVGAAEQILEKYRDEHVKVIKDSQTKGHILKTLMQKAGVGTASAFANLLDTWSEKIKEIVHLENSQKSLQTWNDTYRVQRELVKTLLAKEGVSEEVIDKVNRIYGTRSVGKAVDLGSELFNLEKSEILRLIKAVVRYTKL